MQEYNRHNTISLDLDVPNKETKRLVSVLVARRYCY